MSWMHDRQPAILEYEDLEQWLDGGQENAMSLLRPFGGQFDLIEVSSLVDNIRNNSPSCLEPLELVKQRQKEEGIGRFFRASVKEKGDNTQCQIAGIKPSSAFKEEGEEEACPEADPGVPGIEVKAEQAAGALDGPTVAAHSSAVQTSLQLQKEPVVVVDLIEDSVVRVKCEGQHCTSPPKRARVKSEPQGPGRFTRATSSTPPRVPSRNVVDSSQPRIDTLFRP
mmetsp:Transcript_81171/g.218244  ORF Transcript_81171/g.218244 Transcript_81171/m.218244 type:complete len:225 (-) Transcript_81171:639-1313(-)